MAVFRYDGPSKLVIVTDIVKDWPAAKEWTFEKLSARFPDVEWKIAQKVKCVQTCLCGEMEPVAFTHRIVPFI